MTLRSDLRLLTRVIAPLAFLTLAAGAFAQTAADTAMLARIRAEGLAHSEAPVVFNKLAVEIGPRLTASPAYKRAIDFVQSQLTAWGLSNVHLEPWKFGRGWTLDKFTLEMTAPRFAPLIGYPEAWSPSTAGELEAAPVYLGNKSEAEIEALRPSMKGAIVMTSPIQTVYVTADRVQPTAPGVTPPETLQVPPLFGTPKEIQERLTMVRAAGAGVMLRPNVLRDGTVYVTGRDIPGGVPSIVMSSEHYDMIARMIEQNIPVKLRVDIQGTYQTADTNAYNVIAEIPGSDLKDQVVMLGAHVDSWHTGTGATDNADGVSTMMEAMRILKAVGAKPRRTIRLGIWSGEEQGLLGSKEWVKAHLAGDANKAARDNFSLYINIDNGTGKIYGFGMEHNEGARLLFDKWLAPFEDMGARRNVNTHVTSTDHLSFTAVGVPGFNPLQDYDNYDLREHHTNMDLPDHVNLDDLKQAAIIMASFAYNASMTDQPLPRK